MRLAAFQLVKPKLQPNPPRRRGSENVCSSPPFLGLHLYSWRRRREKAALLSRRLREPASRALRNNVLRTEEPRDLWGRSAASQRNVRLCFPDVPVAPERPEEKLENGRLSPDAFLSKPAAPELLNVAGDAVPPGQFESLADGFTDLRKDHLTHKAACNALLGGAPNCSVPVDDQKAPTPSALEPGPNTLQITPAMAQGINADIKHQLMKEVRKFGRRK